MVSSLKNQAPIPSFSARSMYDRSPWRVAVTSARLSTREWEDGEYAVPLIEVKAEENRPRNRRRWNEQHTSPKKRRTRQASVVRGRSKVVDRKMTIHECIRVVGILAHELKVMIEVDMCDA